MSLEATEISIHRALTLIKTTTRRLEDAIRNGTFISATVGITKKPENSRFKSAAELSKAIQASTDAVENGFKTISTLKAAIAAKNLETKVSFSGKQVSITELLAIKETVQLRKVYYSHLVAQAEKVDRLAEKQESLVAQQLENVPAAEKVTTAEVLKTIHGLETVTAKGVSVTDYLAQVKKDLDFLQEDIDILLSETNLATKITINL